MSLPAPLLIPSCLLAMPGRDHQTGQRLCLTFACTPDASTCLYKQQAELSNSDLACSPRSVIKFLRRSALHAHLTADWDSASPLERLGMVWVGVATNTGLATKARKVDDVLPLEKRVSCQAAVSHAPDFTHRCLQITRGYPARYQVLTSP